MEVERQVSEGRQAGNTGRFLGIDGGGSTTRAVLIDQDGQVISRATAGPSNVLVVGKARSSRAVRKTLATIQGPVTALVAGFAGADRAWIHEMWSDFFTGIRPGTPSWVVADYEVAWGAHTGGEPGVIAIVGTGSVCYGQAGTQRIKIGGYGWKIGDAGSGIRLGQLAVQAALKAMDHLGDETALLNTVLEWAQAHDREGLLARIYAPGIGVRVLAELASMVLRCADDDPVAQALVVCEAERVITQLTATVKALAVPSLTRIGLIGGLAQLWHPFLHAEGLKAGLPLVVVVPTTPDVGAAMMAQHFLFARNQETDVF